MLSFVFLFAGSPVAVPPGSVLHFPSFLLFPIVQTFAGFFRFSLVCFLGQLALPLCLLLLVLGLRFSSLRLRFILSWYTLLSFECRYYFLWCFCLVRISGSLHDVVSLWDESGFAEASLSLSSQGCFLLWYLSLYGSPFCSPASFASKVPLATWSPFGMSLAYFGALSRSGVWFFPVAVPFPTCSRGIHPSLVSSLVAFRGCGLRSLRCICICGCFVSALHLLSSVRRSLFLSWPFFICATPSSVSGCLWVLFLGSVTRSDLRFPLATGLPVGTSPFCFSWPFRLLLQLFRQFLLDIPWVLSLSVSGGLSLPLSFTWIRSALSLSLSIGGCRSPLPFLRFSFRSAFLDSLLLFSLLSFAILHSSSVGFFAFSFLSFGFLPSGSLP